MDAPYVWDRILEGKACIKNPKTCGPSKWPSLTTGMSYSCGQSVSIEKPRDKQRLAYKLVDRFTVEFDILVLHCTWNSQLQKVCSLITKDHSKCPDFFPGHLPPLPSARHLAFAAYLSGYVYACGGKENSLMLMNTECWRLNLTAVSKTSRSSH